MPTTELQTPAESSDSPKSLYVRNLRNSESATWYTTEKSVYDVIHYVLGLMYLTTDHLVATPAGFAETADQKLLFTAFRGPRGSGVTVWGFEGGASVINDAMSREWDKMTDELSRGEYMGNPARANWVPIVNGFVRQDFEGHEILDIINAGAVVEMPAGRPATRPSESGAEDDAWDDGKVSEYLDMDPSVVSSERLSDTGYRVLYRTESGTDVDLFVTTGLNDVMVIVLAPVDGDVAASLSKAVAEIGVVGVTSFGDDAWAIRFGAFKTSSDMMALINGMQAVALGYERFQAQQTGATSDQGSMEEPSTSIEHDETLRLEVTWAAARVDPCVFLLDSERRITTEGDFVFYNNGSSPCGSIKIARATPTAASFAVHLERVPDVVRRLEFCLAAEAGAPTHEQDVDFELRLVSADSNRRVINAAGRFPRSAIVCALERGDDAWRLDPQIHQVDGDLRSLARAHGVPTD